MAVNIYSVRFPVRDLGGAFRSALFPVIWILYAGAQDALLATIRASRPLPALYGSSAHIIAQGPGEEVGDGPRAVFPGSGADGEPDWRPSDGPPRPSAGGSPL